MFLSLQHDHLMTECTYNASGKMSFTRGGFSSTSEMCLVFLESVLQSQSSITDRINEFCNHST